MILKIGKTNDNTMKVNKSFSEVIAENVTIEPTSIVNKLNPVFIVAYDSRYLNANYVYCSELDRYYFCIPSVNTGGRVVLTCTIDYLSGVDLSNCPITVLRNGGIGAPTEIPDNKLPVKPSAENIKQVVVENDAFNNLLNAYPNVIQITGG
jgi:hypothetical protein